MPWRERAEVLRKGMVARVPPMRWSPDDGQRAEMTALATTLVLGGARSGKSAFAEQLIVRQRTGADLPRHRDRR